LRSKIAAIKVSYCRLISMICVVAVPEARRWRDGAHRVVAGLTPQRVQQQLAFIA
jgi:hypothetical protein